MAGLNVVTYAAAKAYTDQTVVGGGALKGKNCTVDSITDITGGHRVTFKWTLDNGTVQTGTMDVMDGVDGADGHDGAPGADGHDGAPGADGLTPTIEVTEITGGHRVTITIGEETPEVFDVMDGAKGEDGDPGPAGQDGVGVPEGGTTGQVLKKKSGIDYDTEWADEEGGTGHGIPSGGTQGQVLRKTSNDDYDADWSDDEGGQIIQVESLPTASSTEEGNIYQYIGTTGGGLTNGYFYECVFDDPDYIWQAKAVQDPGQALNGIPAGGTANQILQKHSNTDYDAEWVDPASYSQQQSDWAQSDNTQVDFIKNKPQNLVQDADYNHTDNNYTDAEVSKLAAIEAGAQVNVKPDWNATAGADEEILNKPTLGTAAAKNVPVSGDAATTEVVMGDDSRLTDARTPVAHQHTTSDITDFPTLGTAAAKDSTNAVTQNDSKLVESGAVYTELDKKVDKVSGKGLSTNDYDASAKAAVDALGTASTKGFTNAVTQSSTNLVESGAVYDAIANAVSSTYKPAGSKTCSQLLPSLLIEANLGKVYNVTDSGTTTSDFVEGAGKPINAGDNIAIVDIGSSTYKFDIL